MRRGLVIFIIVIISVLLIFLVTFLYSRSWKNALFIKPMHHLETDEKLIALTFDDGPSSVRTPALLELLNEYDVKASFFMLGDNIHRYPDIAKQVFNEGHLIGNHSYNHPRMIFKSAAFVKEQISETDLLIKATGQERVVYMRPPYTSKYVILPLVLLSMNKTLVTGTYDPPAEYKADYIAKDVAEEVITNAFSGSIIYLHDGKDSDQKEFIESVELIIKGLHDEGYSFVRIDHE